MPLGQSGYGDYGYFDIPGAFSGYEGALMDLAGSQKTDFWDFLGDLGPMLQQLMEQKRQRELQGWEQGMQEKRLGVQQDYLGIALEKLKRLQNQPPESPYGKPPWWTEGLTPGQVGQYQKKQVEPKVTEPTIPEAVKKSQRKLTWQRLKTKIDAQGQHTLSPPEWKGWRRLDMEFSGKEGFTTEDISKKYMTYVAGAVKQNETIRGKMALGETEETIGRSIQPIMSLDEYTGKFKQAGIAPEPLTELPPKLTEELREFDNYDGWYDSLSGADRGAITADEIKIIKAWFMNR